MLPLVNYCEHKINTMEIQLKTGDTLLNILVAEPEGLEVLYKNAVNGVLSKDVLEPGFLIQQSQGIWEFMTAEEAESILEQPASFPFIFPYIYQVEVGNTIPGKAEYSVRDVAVNYADQLTAYVPQSVYND
jgi:hypothetical protein